MKGREDGLNQASNIDLEILVTITINLLYRFSRNHQPTEKPVVVNPWLKRADRSFSLNKSW